MAVVSSINSNWELLAGKNLTRQSALGSRIKEAVVCVAIGACMYPACAAGYTVDLSLCGRITTIIRAEPENLRTGACDCILTVTQYVPAACDAAATGTLHLYETAVGVVCGCTNIAQAALAEIPDCACDAACKTVKFHVTGF